MKLLVLNYEYPPVGGGGGRACADLCKALAKRGYEIRILTSWVPGLPRLEQVDGYQVKRVWSGRRLRFQAGFVDMAAYILFGLIPAIREVQTWRPELIHVHFGVPTGVLALMVHWITGLPYVLTGHLGDVPGGVPEKTEGWFRFVNPFTPPIWRNAARVVAVSHYTRSLIYDRYQLEAQVIPNGIEVSKGRGTAVHEPPRLIFAGRFQPQKNLEFLFDSLAQLSDRAWMLTMVGDGPLRLELERIAADRSLDGRIHFTGWVDPHEVEALLEESDLLVMPSQAEGLPVVSVQALAHGVAMAVTSAGGLRDVVDDGINGFKVQVGAQDEYVKRLDELLADPSKITAMKRASLIKADEFSLDRVADSYEQVFQEVLA
jgi:glycosyltransferase involved in cell wall biosynthesis